MHPAVSIIAFTTLSGLGFGMMVWLGLAPPDATPLRAAILSLMALGLAGGGLLASLFHLGNPQRFLLALTQWRSSWLSREGVAAIITMGVFAVYGLLWTLGGQPIPALGALVAGLALITIFSTSMIYAQMKTVPRWHSPLTPVLFIAFALAGGALLSNSLTVAPWLLLILGAVQIIAWRSGDGRFEALGTTTGTATGLGALGRVRMLEAPHSGENYLTHEMGFKIARKHARKLRVIGLAMSVVVPLALLLAWPVPAMIALATAMHVLGTLTTRWLFFAEARHVMSLYYAR